MTREPAFGKNISLKASNIEIIQGFMNKTKKNFSQTVNIIIKQWDDYSIFMLKYKRDRETQKELDRFEEMKKAKIEKVKK